MSEFEKMVRGDIYDPGDPELVRMRRRAHDLSRRYGACDEGSAEGRKVLCELLPGIRDDTEIVAPAFFDYGLNFHVGKGCFVNSGVTVLDECGVTFGDDVLVGPGCTFATAMHPLLPRERTGLDLGNGSGPKPYEYALPIAVGSDCWIASNVTVCPGVEIGDGSVIGAGSVVTRDVPPGVLAAGNPCRVIRPLTPEDTIAGRVV